MKLTNGEIFNAKEPLNKLLEERLPVKVSFALAKIAQKLNEKYEVIEMTRAGLIRTYGKVDPLNPRHQLVTPDCDGFSKFEEEFKELMEQEVELVIEKVTLPDTLEVQPVTLMALEKFVKV